MRGAVNGLMVEVLEGHLRDHLAAESSSRRRHKDLEHVVRVVKSYLK
jgi:DNA-binding FrmR family transcriptional regulator